MDNLEIVWEANIKKETKKSLFYENSKVDLKWNVWGGAVIDKKNNQLVFSTSNPRPGFVSKNRIWSINAYGRNLTDEITKVAFFASDAIVGSPRQVGISLTARF